MGIITSCPMAMGGKKKISQFADNPELLARTIRGLKFWRLFTLGMALLPLLAGPGLTFYLILSHSEVSPTLLLLIVIGLILGLEALCVSVMVISQNRLELLEYIQYVRRHEPGRRIDEALDSRFGIPAMNGTLNADGSTRRPSPMVISLRVR